MDTNTSKHLMATHEFHDALKRGSVAKLIKAIRAGQPMHPKLPINISARGAELSPLTMAYQWDWTRKPDACLQLLQALIDAGADPNRCDELGRRPLNMMVWLSSAPKEAFQALIRGGADAALTHSTNSNTVPQNSLVLALAHGRLDALEWMLEADPDAVRRCEVTDSPLRYLAWNHRTILDKECEKIVRLLLKYGDDPEAGDKFGRTPLTIADRIVPMVRRWQEEISSEILNQQLDADTPPGQARSTSGPRL